MDGGGRLTKLAIDPILVDAHGTRGQNLKKKKKKITDFGANHHFLEPSSAHLLP